MKLGLFKEKAILRKNRFGCVSDFQRTKDHLNSVFLKRIGIQTHHHGLPFFRTAKVTMEMSISG